MSKKHFIELADIMRSTKPDASISGRTGDFRARMVQWNWDCARLADFCASQNYGFMRDRWFGYINGTCGPSGGAVKNAA